jgi:hypothetical protein
VGKYILGYVLLGLFVVLGTFLVCRPSRRQDPGG